MEAGGICMKRDDVGDRRRGLENGPIILDAEITEWREDLCGGVDKPGGSAGKGNSPESMSQ